MEPIKRLNPATAIFVAGHGGMVGAACLRRLKALGCERVITAPREELDLRDAPGVDRFFASRKPEVVILAAARVGGIKANSELGGDFILENLGIEVNVMRAAFESGVARVVFLGSSCIYPKFAAQPIAESALLEGPLEPTNEGYALAKIAGLKLCQLLRKQYGVCYYSLMPCNLYGPGDSYHPDRSHVIPGLIRRFHEAKEKGLGQVSVWGTGKPKREFLHVNDLASFIGHSLSLDNPPDWVNVGTGDDLTVRELAEKIRTVVGYEGRIVFDSSKPDGTPRKVLDVALAQSLGWKARIGLDEGLRDAYQDFQSRWATATLRE